MKISWEGCLSYEMLSSGQVKNIITSTFLLDIAISNSFGMWARFGHDKEHRRKSYMIKKKSLFAHSCTDHMTASGIYINILRHKENLRCTTLMWYEYWMWLVGPKLFAVCLPKTYSSSASGNGSTLWLSYCDFSFSKKRHQKHCKLSPLTTLNQASVFLTQFALFIKLHINQKDSEFLKFIYLNICFS